MCTHLQKECLEEFTSLPGACDVERFRANLVNTGRTTAEIAKELNLPSGSSEYEILTELANRVANNNLDPLHIPIEFEGTIKTDPSLNISKIIGGIRKINL